MIFRKVTMVMAATGVVKGKDKYDPALADGDHQRHTDIQRNVQNA